MTKGLLSVLNGVFLFSSAIERGFASWLLKNERFTIVNDYRSTGDLLKSIYDVGSAEECSVWCRSMDQCGTFNFNAGHCELLSEVHTVFLVIGHSVIVSLSFQARRKHTLSIRVRFPSYGGVAKLSISSLSKPTRIAAA